MILVLNVKTMKNCTTGATVVQPDVVRNSVSGYSSGKEFELELPYGPKG